MSLGLFEMKPRQRGPIPGRVGMLQTSYLPSLLLEIASAIRRRSQSRAIPVSTPRQKDSTALYWRVMAAPKLATNATTYAMSAETTRDRHPRGCPYILARTGGMAESKTVITSPTAPIPISIWIGGAMANDPMSRDRSGRLFPSCRVCAREQPARDSLCETPRTSWVPRLPPREPPARFVS